MHRLETALGTTFTFDSPSGERLGEALEAHRAEVGQREEATKQAPRARGDNHRARLRERLESRRQVRGLADYSLLAAPSPSRSPTTTRPVAIPTRAASGAPAGVHNSCTASTSASPARTARSASSSCAFG
jgi:hypothetical protein